MSTALEQEKITVKLSRAKMDFSSNASLNALFENQAVQKPDAIALDHEGRRWTHKELNQRSNQIAHCLREAGAQPESLVGICIEDSPELVAGILAILKTGSASVPIDRAYPEHRRSLMLEGVPLLLTTKNLADEFTGRVARVICVDDENVLRASGESLPSISNERDRGYKIDISGLKKAFVMFVLAVVALIPMYLVYERSDTAWMKANGGREALLAQLREHRTAYYSNRMMPSENEKRARYLQGWYECVGEVQVTAFFWTISWFL